MGREEEYVSKRAIGIDVSGKRRAGRLTGWTVRLDR